MLDDEKVNQFLDKLNQLRDERIDKLSEEHTDLNNLIADMINGLEILFIIVNAQAAQVTKPQRKRSSTFVTVSTPNESKTL